MIGGLRTTGSLRSSQKVISACSGRRSKTSVDSGVGTLLGSLGSVTAGALKGTTLDDHCTVDQYDGRR